MAKFRTDIGGWLGSEPPVDVPVEVSLAAQGLVGFTYSPERPCEVLPPEAMLRAIHGADSSDEAVLLTLSRAVGEFTVIGWSDTVAVNEVLHVLLRPELRVPDLRTRMRSWDALRARHRHDVPPDGVSLVPVDLLAFSADLLASLVAHRRAELLGDDVTEAWRWLLRSRRDCTPARCWALFQLMMNALLRPFSPTLTVDGLPAGLAHLQEEERPRVAEVLALQLFNTIVDDIPLRQCAECGVTFAHHQGRSAAGQYRQAGVIYCSHKCSKRHADRVSKRRRRQQQRSS